MMGRSEKGAPHHGYRHHMPEAVFIILPRLLDRFKGFSHAYLIQLSFHNEIDYKSK